MANTNLILETELLEPTALQQMYERGGDWCAYRSHDMSQAFSVTCASCSAAKAEHSSPPDKYPDSQFGIG